MRKRKRRKTQKIKSAANEPGKEKGKEKGALAYGTMPR
jgi:hypothetical protein